MRSIVSKHFCNHLPKRFLSNSSAASKHSQNKSQEVFDVSYKKCFQNMLKVNNVLNSFY